MGHFYTLPNDKLLDLSKIKALAGDNLNVSKMAKFIFDRPENIMGKEENAGSFNPFPYKPWFSRVCSTNLLKTLRERRNCS